MLDPRSPDYAWTPVAPTRPQMAYAPLRTLGSDLKPVVTVITPFFNTGEVFHETARNILAQSLQQFEWIIINDGSSNADSLRMLDEYRAMVEDPARIGPRIRVIDHKRNLGLAATRNTGYRHAMADLVFQIDADDLIEPTTLEKCAWRMHSRPNEPFTKGKTIGFEGDRYLWDKGFHNGAAFVQENLATATAMIRLSAWKAVGGFDETIRQGMEDWDFWLRCAEAGLWGSTINEYLDWYRRRPNQHADWQNLATTRGQDRFRGRIRDLCPRLSSGWWPAVDLHWPMPMEDVRPAPPFENLLRKERKRLLIVLPWMRLGGADRYNLDLVKCLTTGAPDHEPWEVTIATTVWAADNAHAPVGDGNEWFGEFAKYTPDIFMSHNYVRLADSPSFLEYLIKSRTPDVVMVTNSRLGYQLLPYLRERCPKPVYVDFNHMEEPWWKNGGHPRTGIGYQEQLDLSMTVSRHLKDWMAERGANEHRIETCYINADTERWKPNAEWRAGMRAEVGIAESTPVVLYAARLCAQKQPMVFAETIRRVRDLLEPNWQETTAAFDKLHGPYTERRARFEREHAEFDRENSPEHEPGQIAQHAAKPKRPAPMPRPKSAFVAVVAGDGELLGQLRDFCERHRLIESGHIELVGAVTTDAMPGYMAASDIFFLPSRWEGIALSIYEAMSSGLAVLGADVGGQRELVTPRTGVLMSGPDECQCPEIEAQAYAYALAGLVLNGKRREAMGLAARERIKKHFELDHMRARMLELFTLGAERQERSPREAVGKGLARELATTAVEFARMDALNEELWGYRVRCEQLERERAEHHQRWHHAIAHELHLIEHSKAWKAVQRVKELPAYRVYARARWGPDWRTIELKGTPEERLGRIKGSRSFRLINAMKRSPAYHAYTRFRDRGHS